MSNKQPNKKLIDKAIRDDAADKKMKMRQVIIETDGTNIKVSKNETSGNLELAAILNTLLQYLSKPKQ